MKLPTEPPVLHAQGHLIDPSPECFGWLRESTDVLDDTAELHRRMEEDGYLLIRGYLDPEEVLAARREILEKLASVDEIDPDFPLIDGIWSGKSNRAAFDASAFAKSIRTGAALRKLLQGGRMVRFFERFLGGEVRPLDWLWVRMPRVGQSTGCHYDVVYMGRGTHHLYTAWTPLGSVPLTDGPLLILENSHRLEELKRTYGAIDVDRDRDKNPWGGGWFSRNPVEVRRRYGGRWLTSAFEPGDLLVFGMYTLHCSADNASPVNRIRLSSDSRYQLASEPADERWVGDDPPAHDLEKQEALAARGRNA